MTTDLIPPETSEISQDDPLNYSSIQDEGNDDEVSEIQKCERLYKAISMRFNDIVHDKIYPYALSRDPKVTQAKWTRMFERARRKMANDSDEDDDNESGPEYFQITQSDAAVSKGGAVKGTIEAIVSTAKGAEKKRRRESRQQRNASSQTGSSPLLAAAEIVSEIDKLSDKQWSRKQPVPDYGDGAQTDTIIDLTSDNEAQTTAQANQDRLDAYLDESYSTPPNHVTPAPEDTIFPCDSLSETTATPSPTPHTLASSTSSHTTVHAQPESSPILPVKKKLVPFVIIYNKPRNGKRPKIQTSAKSSLSSRHVTPSTPVQRPSGPSQTSSVFRRRKPTVTKHISPFSSIIFYYPRSRLSCGLAYKPRFTIERLNMLCTRVRTRAKERRARAGSASTPSRRVHHDISVDIGEVDAEGGPPIFLKRNIKIGRRNARRGSLSARMGK